MRTKSTLQLISLMTSASSQLSFSMRSTRWGKQGWTWSSNSRTMESRTSDSENVAEKILYNMNHKQLIEVACKAYQQEDEDGDEDPSDNDSASPLFIIYFAVIINIINVGFYPFGDQLPSMYFNNIWEIFLIKTFQFLDMGPHASGIIWAITLVMPAMVITFPCFNTVIALVLSCIFINKYLSLY